MKRGLKGAFGRLQEIQRRKSYRPELLLPDLWGEVSSLHPKGSLGYMADQLRMPCDILSETFAKAGISGLLPQHRISDLDKSVLLDYLRRIHSGKEGSETVKLYEDDKSLADQIVVVQEITTELLRMLASDPQLMYLLEPRKFEEFVARLLEDQGCEVTLTKRSRDGGYDIFGRIRGSIASPVFLAECKRYAPDNKVGVEIVRGLYGVTEAHRANIGLVITSSTFTKDAVEEKIRIGNRIELKAFDDLCAWLSPYRRP